MPVNKKCLNNSSMIRISFRNDCEMTHFFFSLNREPLAGQKISDMPITFSFDTHIITQININVKHTLFDKVFYRQEKTIYLYFHVVDICNWRNFRSVLWSFNHHYLRNISSYFTFLIQKNSELNKTIKLVLILF